MKPINTLSAMVSPSAGSEEMSGSKSVSGHGQPPIDREREAREFSSSNPSPESELSSNQSRMSQSDKLDRKLLVSREGPLSLIKHSQLSLFVPNNKVASSFRNQTQAMMNRQQLQQQLQAPLILPVSLRKVRDSGSLLFMLAFLGFLAYIIWEGLVVKETDVNLIVHGHDSYGNICGRNNRPIRFVDRSGKNYTTKPYTKYTLINAQFERYTLDSQRLKNGELFYVREENELLLRNLEKRMSTRKDANFKSRSKRSPQLTSLHHLREQIVKNQTLRNNLKSTLMYQYPPMYGYSPSGSTTTTMPTASVNTTKHENILKFKTLDSIHSSNEASRVLDSAHNEEASSVTTTARAADRGASYAPSDSSAPAEKGLAASTSLTRKSSVPSVIAFDDHGNESDHFEHTFVRPISTNTRTTFPEGFYQNEVSSQLLYLTECVDHCPADHIELIFYRCMPRNWRFSLFPNAINVTRTFIDDVLTDLTHCYRELVYIFSFALVLSLGLLILLRFLASFIIWSCLTLLITLFLSMAGYSWFGYYTQVVDLNNMMPHDSIYPVKLASSDKWLVGAIFLTIIAFATIGTVIFMRRRILLVTTLFRESGKAIADMPLLLLQPVLTFGALLAITILWSIGLICIQSMKNPVIDISTGFVVFKAETIYKIMKWYHIFAFLWVSHFAIACQHYVIGAAVSKWYFSTNRYELNSPIGSSVSELILYYLGSVALGSFLVAIFKVIRIITVQIQYLVQRNCLSPNLNSNGTPAGPNDSSINPNQASSSMCGSFSYLWRLFIWFFDNIVMIISRDAYVEIAIHGHGFLAGAQQAFTVLASNPLRLLAIKSVSNVLLVVAKICVVFGTVSMAIMLSEEKTNQLNYSWSPIVISAIYAYIVAHWFLSVYEMVIDALFICYCEDYERSKLQEARVQLTGSNFMSQILNNRQSY